MPYHVYVYHEIGNATLYAIDLTEEDLRTRFLTPYERGQGVTWDGRTIGPGQVDVILVWETDAPIGQVGTQGWRTASEAGNNVTNRFITGPPGAAAAAEAVPTEPGVARDPRRVMIVHGRNRRAVDAMATFLASLGLEPILWEDAIEETAVGSPHNLEAVMAAMQVAQAVVVLFTAEDEARLMEMFRGDGDSDDLVGQPRPNVFLEAGMAMALGRDRAILTRLGDFRGASDVDGLNSVRLGNEHGPRTALRRRLAKAGCAVNDRDHYLDTGKAGDFDAAVPA